MPGTKSDNGSAVAREKRDGGIRGQAETVRLRFSAGANFTSATAKRKQKQSFPDGVAPVCAIRDNP
jgi:hypothetical protein